MGDSEWLENAKWLWDQREVVSRQLTRLRRWFRGDDEAPQPKPGIIILGAGGVGKSTLAAILSAEHTFLTASGLYEESIGVETYSLPGSPDVEITVPPGQKHRRDATWSDLQSGIANGEYRGIILVGAYGYHTLGLISYRDHRLYENNKADFLEAYLADRRAEEIEVLHQLVPHIRQCRSKLWILTVVTKQDLWSNRSSDVERHYREGEYAAALNGLLNQTDPRNLRHETAFASLVISKFETGKHEPLALNIAGYDQPMQTASLRRLCETVDSLREWEEST